MRGKWKRLVAFVTIGAIVVIGCTLLVMAMAPRSADVSLNTVLPMPSPSTTPVPSKLPPVATPISTPRPVVASPAPVKTSPQYIGMFIDASPSDPNFRQTLDQVAATGCNLIYSYNAYDGTTEQVDAFLAYAQSKGLRVIIALNDFYDQLPQSATTAATYSQYGSTNQAIALAIVNDFQANPAVWGFSITDEAPEGPSDLAAWQSTLVTRYQQIKQLTAKPVMAVLVGWPDGAADNRINFFQASKSFSDVLALDYYPVPYLPLSRISQIMNEAGSGNWFVEQDFSWSSYPQVAASLGDDLSQARLPTMAEMITMGQLALQAGAQNLLFYSDFDIENDPAQLAAVTQAVQALKN